MIVVGIISVPETKVKLYKRYFKPAYIKENLGVQYLVAELSVSAEQMCLLSKRILKKIIGYAEKLLKKNGATHIILTKECKGALLNSGIINKFENQKTTRIPCDKILDAYKYIVDKTVNFNRNYGLLITDTDLSSVNYNFIEKLCTNVKYITLHTDKTEKAYEISEKLFLEYGILIEITNNRLNKKSFYEIDFNRRIVRAGDFVIDGAEFISGATNYSLDTAEEAACFGNENKLGIKNWFSGKNKLKIS